MVESMKRVVDKVLESRCFCDVFVANVVENGFLPSVVSAVIPVGMGEVVCGFFAGEL